MSYSKTAVRNITNYYTNRIAKISLKFKIPNLKIEFIDTEFKIQVQVRSVNLMLKF